jgi:PAS domain S-box-containing protein
MPFSSPLAVARSAVNASPLSWWRRWWRRQTPVLQDAVAMLAPMAAVLLFLAAIVSAFWYLRTEEVEREQESVRRDVEYAQQRMRLRLLERQEQLMRIARDASNREIDPVEFTSRAESLVSQFPELQTITWIDDRRRFKAGYAAPSVHPAQQHLIGDVLRPGDIESNYALARELRQPVYSQPVAGGEPAAMLQLHIPLFDQGLFAGVVLGEFSVDGLLRYGMPSEVQARYAVSLLDAKGHVIAGNTTNLKDSGTRLLPWTERTNEYEVPVSPVGNALVLRAQAYRTSQGVVGNGLFWLVCALSVLTSWMLIGTWRHTRRRLQAQQRLVAETNFRRAMENSMLTGMRVLDLQGRITYVNAAFCAMTGWSEEELVGQSPPFPYWLESDREMMNERLEEELHGRALPGGFQVRVKRKNGSVFNARLYVSPLIDARGHQTGWMTSMTDITEPTRIREQLSASYERFTTVLEALDAAVSVAPIGSEELLFANKLYRLWFGSDTVGHLGMVAQAGVPASNAHDEGLDDVDPYAGLPIDTLTAAQAANNEIFVPHLGKWLEVRSRYLTWVDGRLAQLVIATDITPRRDAEEQAAAQADKAQSASRLITMGEMASSVGARAQPAADRHHQLLQRDDVAHQGADDRHRGTARCARENVQAGAARGPDHSAHPLLREAQRAQPHSGRRGHHGERGGRAGRHRAAPAQRAPEPLRGRAAAGGARRPDPDRAGDGQFAEERGRIHRHCRPAAGAPQRRAAGAAQGDRRAQRHRVLGTGHRQGPGP